MNLLEYQAKSLLSDHELSTPKSWLVFPGKTVPSDVVYPVVAKSQVPVGGRGKAGGIVNVESADELPEALGRLFALPIKDHIPSAILLEQKLSAHRELYLSLRLNRDSRQIEWLVSPHGGIDIEDNAKSVQTFPHGDSETPDNIATILEVAPEILTPLLSNLERCFFEGDLLLCEINPLVLLKPSQTSLRPTIAGSVLANLQQLVCLDAKMVVDDNARFRHPELSWPPAEGNLPLPLGGVAVMLDKAARLGVDLSEIKSQNLDRTTSVDTVSKNSETSAAQARPKRNFIEDGSHYIGCIANGAGMAMSTMDTIVAAGGKPANFLDIGGGTGEKEFVTALKNIMELPGVTSIIVNIFAGISRCDEIARGIIAAREQLPNLPPLFIRLEGTNRDIAAKLLTDVGVTIEPDLKSCVQKAIEVTI